MKKLEFHGSSLRDLKGFPEDVRKDMGYQLHKVQKGEDPDDWKPLTTVGSGVKEIRIRDNGNIYRSIYIAKFEDAVHVLHAFQKKDQQTRQRDIDLAKKRLDNLRERRK